VAGGKTTKLEAEFSVRLGMWLQQLRRNRKLSRRALGEAVGVHRNTVARFEHGTPLHLWMFLRICEELEVPPEEVLKW
jgi:transcriptional regulator with XRE-family HTH domain